MRVLIVCSGNASNFDFERHQAFIFDQTEAVKKLTNLVQFDYFFIKQKGVIGYLSHLRELKQLLKKNKFDCIHAHVAASALLANMQRQVPVITTFHGSDLNLKSQRWLSALVAILSHRVIYVSEQLWNKSFFKLTAKSYVIPCGVSFDLFKPVNKSEARQHLGLSSKKKYILFSSHLENQIKNPQLALLAVEQLTELDVKMIELKGYSRGQVALLMAAADIALMTSYSEGSPQFVKEALACNCPVVSTKVGDVASILTDVPNCYLVANNPTEVAAAIRKVLSNDTHLEGIKYIKRFDNHIIARQIFNIYQLLND